MQSTYWNTMAKRAVISFDSTSEINSTVDRTDDRKKQNYFRYFEMRATKVRFSSIHSASIPLTISLPIVPRARPYNEPEHVKSASRLTLSFLSATQIHSPGVDTCVSGSKKGERKKGKCTSAWIRASSSRLLKRRDRDTEIVVAWTPCHKNIFFRPKTILLLNVTSISRVITERARQSERREKRNAASVLGRRKTINRGKGVETSNGVR